MKISIALTLIITIAVFSFVSGYSISVHHKMYSAGMASLTNTANNGPTKAVGQDSAASGGYGSPNSEKAGENSESSAGYGTPSPGYGQ
jgi:hypothetical protein